VRAGAAQHVQVLMEKTMNPTKTTEAQTLKAIMDWLQAKGILAYRMNVLAMPTADGKRFIKAGVPGMADILAFPGAFCVYWIEVKAPKGIQSELQKSFQKQVEDHGHRYIVARSLEDVTSLLPAYWRGE